MWSCGRDCRSKSNGIQASAIEWTLFCITGVNKNRPDTIEYVRGLERWVVSLVEFANLLLKRVKTGYSFDFRRDYKVEIGLPVKQVDIRRSASQVGFRLLDVIVYRDIVMLSNDFLCRVSTDRPNRDLIILRHEPLKNADGGLQRARGNDFNEVTVSAKIRHDFKGIRYFVHVFGRCDGETGKLLELTGSQSVFFGCGSSFRVLGRETDIESGFRCPSNRFDLVCDDIVKIECDIESRLFLWWDAWYRVHTAS